MIRDVEHDLEKFLRNKSINPSRVLIVNGARQVGKTFLINSTLKNFSKVISINLEEDLRLKREIDQTEDFTAFTLLLKQRKALEENKGQILFIDEAQESAVIGRYVRFMKENWKGIKVILSGSSMNKLFNEETRIPVGRIRYLTIHPFSFGEFLRFINKEDLLLAACKEKTIPSFLHSDLLQLYDQYLAVGGMPAAVSAFAEKENYKEILADILASQNEDFLRKESVKNYLFTDALKGVANHVGGISKYVHLAQNNYDAKKIIEQLKAWNLVLEVEQKGLLSHQNFAPKRYLYDLGLLRLIRDTAIPSISVVNTIDEALRIPLGGIVENAVLLAFFARHQNTVQITGWKKNNKESIEVDFIIKDATDEVLPIEVKAATKISPRHFSSLLSYMRMTKTTNARLVSFAPPEKFKLDGITITNTPAYLI